MNAKELWTVASNRGTVHAQGLQVTPKEIPGQPHALLLPLAGYVDSYNAGSLRREVERLLSIGYVDLLFDLERVEYVSSLGMGTFVDLQKSARLLHGDVFLSRVQPRVYKIFKLLGFSTRFSSTDSVEQAIERLSSTARTPVFPSIRRCPVCGRRLKLTRQGRFRCRECRTVLLVDASGDLAVA